MPTKVTCLDVEKGDTESRVIENDWILITDGDCELTNTQVYANGTVVLTVKRADRG
jgi:hypothetical protein